MGATSIGIEHWGFGVRRQSKGVSSYWFVFSEGRKVGGFCNYRKLSSVLYLKNWSNSLENCKLDVFDFYTAIRLLLKIFYAVSPVPMPVPRLSGFNDKMLRSLILPR